MSRRWVLFVIALLLVALVSSIYMSPEQARCSPTWIEVYPPRQPRIMCSQGGKPSRVLVDVQLWPGGPGIKLMQENQLHLPLNAYKKMARGED